MFPGIDKETLVSAVVHHGGDVNAAVSTLLDSSGDPVGQDSRPAPGWECAICLDNEQDTPSCTLCCGHAFCRGCLQKWVKEAKQLGRTPACPCCRRAIGQKELDNVSPPERRFYELDEELSHRLHIRPDIRQMREEAYFAGGRFGREALDLLMQRLHSGSAGSQLRSVTREQARHALRSADGNLGHAITYLIRYRPATATVASSNPPPMTRPRPIPPTTRPRPTPPTRREFSNRPRGIRDLWGLVTGR